MITRVLSVLAALGLLGSAGASGSDKPITKRSSSAIPANKPVPSPLGCSTDGQPMPPLPPCQP
jgi:hypothetical protein